jgi:energy-converting hydrogenase B subunit D
MDILVLITVIVMLASAAGVLLLKEFLSALAALSVVSLGLSVLFVILRAPDVARTEAAIGAGLGSLLFALALRRLGLWQINSKN